MTRLRTLGSWCVVHRALSCNVIMPALFNVGYFFDLFIFSQPNIRLICLPPASHLVRMFSFFRILLAGGKSAAKPECNNETVFTCRVVTVSKKIGHVRKIFRNNHHCWVNVPYGYSTTGIFLFSLFDAPSSNVVYIPKGKYQYVFLMFLRMCLRGKRGYVRALEQRETCRSIPMLMPSW